MRFQSKNCSTIPVDPVVPPIVPPCPLLGERGEKGEKGDTGAQGKGLMASVATTVRYRRFFSTHTYNASFRGYIMIDTIASAPKHVLATVQCAFPTHCYVTMGQTSYTVYIRFLKNQSATVNRLILGF